MPEIMAGVATLLVSVGWMLWAAAPNGILKAASNAPRRQRRDHDPASHGRRDPGGERRRLRRGRLARARHHAGLTMTPRRIANRFLGFLTAAALFLILASVFASVHA
jgi:hypothetical protein